MTRKISLKNVSDETKVGFNIGAVQALLWLSWSFSAYAMVYLQQMGFTASVVGNINAINSAVAIFSVMLFGMLSDKINSVKKVLILTTIIGGALYTFTPFLPMEYSFSIVLVFAYYAITNVFRAVIPTLMDNISIRICTAKRLNYGIVRAGGSLFFTIGCFIAAWVVSNYSIDLTFFLFGILLIPPLLLLFKTYDPKNPNSTTNKKQKVSLAPLLKNYHYLTFMIVTAIIQFAITSEYNFFSYLMEDIGVSSDNFANILAVKALMEIPFLLLTLKLRARFKLKHLIMTAFCLMSLECVLLAFWANDLTTIIISALFFGLGNGIFLGSLPVYLFKLAPDNLKASAQTMYASVCATAGIISSLVGGQLFDVLGGRVFYMIICGFFISGVVFFVVSLNMKKSLVNPADTKD